MNPELETLLEYLEARVDLGQQEEIQTRYHKALRWETVERLPIIFSYPLPDDAPFRPYPHREVFDDPEKMLYNQLVHAFDASILCHARLGDDLPYTVRPNFGTVVVASLFGGRVEQLEDNPPWVKPFATQEEFQAAIQRDPLDVSQGWCPKLVQTYQCYHEALSRYPRLRQVVKIVLPDLQGPLDTVELLRGSRIYTDMYDRPELVQTALERAAAAQIGLAGYFQTFTNDGPDGFCHQHATTLPGRMLLRNDSAILLSARMYRRHVAFHDERVLRELDGSIHACGKVAHVVPEFLRLPSLRSIDLGQPELNDLTAIYAQAQQRRIPLIRLDVPEDELLSGRVLQRFPTGVTLKHQAASLQDAQRILAAYRGSETT
jgi:hypothetical protein